VILKVCFIKLVFPSVFFCYRVEARQSLAGNVRVDSVGLQRCLELLAELDSLLCEDPVDGWYSAKLSGLIDDIVIGYDVRVGNLPQIDDHITRRGKAH
jgi:hypothetical protein